MALRSSQALVAIVLLSCRPGCSSAADVDLGAGATISNASMPDGYEAMIWATDLGRPRGITMAANGDLLVVERTEERVTALFDDDGDGASGPDERVVLAEADDLNHGIVIHGGYLYASSDEQVFRWPYTAGARTNLGDPELVIEDIPGRGHSTRTIVFDAEDRLYVQVGSAGNVDSDSSRSRIRRFVLPDPLPEPIAFNTGEVFADGLRNEVGLAFDSQGRLWGVENGLDNLNRDDLGGDIHNDNPAEEVNLFVEAGRFYGYPYCWSEFRLPEGVGQGPGTQYVHERFIDDGTHTDAWCQDPENVVPPRFSMQAHAAPLDITFYERDATSSFPFPADIEGDAFISFHGSWNRDTPTGYKVVRLRFDDGNPVGLEPFFEYGGSGDIADAWPHRPVGIQVGLEGDLFVTSDASGVVIRIRYREATR